MFRRAVSGVLALLGVVALGLPAVAADSITKEAFGATAGGTPVEIYTLVNAKGTKARIMTYGATLVSLEVADKDGKKDDIVLGFDSVAEYEKGSPYFGCTVGRYANRIGGAKFSLDGTEYTLSKNDGDNTLHGGKVGFDKVVWTAEVVTRKKGGQSLKFSYTSKDGEQGFPGTLKCSVTYSLTDMNKLRLQYEATTDKKTVCNLTHHSYFNLSGAGNGDILKQEMTIFADKFTPVDAKLIPTGELKDLTGSPLDFRTATAIGARIEADDEQLKLGKGYDHNYVLRAPGSAKRSMRKAAFAYDPATGRTLEMATTEPGVQFYTGNFLDGTLKGKDGKVYPHRGAFCLEAQKFPDTPNKPSFPSATLAPGETYTQTTVYSFGTK